MRIFHSSSLTPRPLLLAAALWPLCLAPGAFANDGLCIKNAPGPPPKKTPVSELNEMDLPRMLIPFRYAKNGRVAAKGKYYDAKGRVYRYADVAFLVESKQYGAGLEQADVIRAKRYYESGWDCTPRPQMPYDDRLFEPACRPKDKQAWIEAKERARYERGQNRIANDGATRQDRFQQALCRFNQYQAMASAIRKEANQEMEQAKETTKASDIPMSAWAFTKQIYEALEMEPPTDERAHEADVTAVWVAVKELGGPKAVIEKARKSREERGQDLPLADLLKDPSKTSTDQTQSPL